MKLSPTRRASAVARPVVRPTARLTVFVAMFATLAGCRSDDVTNASRMQVRARPASTTSAAVGNATGFTFLQPTVRVPSTIEGTFDPLRPVSVKVVCVAATGPVCPSVATFQRGTGAGDIRLDLPNEAFTLNWTTPSSLEIGEARYRIEVWDGGATPIGSAHARVSITTRDAALAGDGQIAIIRGKPVAIRFRVTTIDNAPPALAGDPGAPAVAAIVLQPAPRTGQNFTAGHPDLPGLPTSVNDVIVHVRTDATIGQINAALRLAGGTVVGGVPGIPAVVPGMLIVRFGTTTHAALAETLTRLRAQPGILDARADVKLDVNVVPKANAAGTTDLEDWQWTGLTLGSNWGLKYMAVPQMWNLNEWASVNGTPTEVGVLDGGFFAHDDLALFDDRSAGITDTHGTHVAGIIGARFNNGVGIDGLNPFAQLRAEVPAGMAGLITAISMHITNYQNERVINVSLGYNWHLFTPFVDAENNAGAQARARADGQSVLFGLQTMALQGKALPVIVAAAGNDSRKNGTGVQQAKWNSPLTNAALEFYAAPIIVVESIDEDGKRSSSTAIGGHLAAPGVNILSTTKGARYEKFSGTSMAAPHIAGLISYLYSLDPTLAKPTMTSNPMRALLERNSRPVVASPVPSVNAFNAALDIDRVRGNDRFLRVLLDIDDGSSDGNLRVNAFGQVVLSDDLDGNGRLGDGLIDMSDFRRFRDHLLDIEDIEGNLGTPLFLNGAANNAKRDLNRDGVVSLDERYFARADFNGDARVSPTRTAKMSGALDGQLLTDLQVLQSRFDDPHYAIADLPALLYSADVTFNLTPCFGRPGVGFVRIVAYPHGSTAITHQRLVLSNAQVQVVTVPTSSTGVDFDVILLAPDGITPVQTRREFAPADLGQDTFITPPCASVSITPLNPSVGAGTSLQFSATVTGAANTAVTWSATGGTISSSGLFTAGSTLGEFAVRATSVADPLAFASTPITIRTATPAPATRVTLNVVTTSGSGFVKQRVRARVEGAPPNSEIRWTASMYSDGSGFLRRGPTPELIQSFVVEAAVPTGPATFESFADLTYLPSARTFGGIEWTVRACLFVDGVQARNFLGADVCLEIVQLV